MFYDTIVIAGGWSVGQYDRDKLCDQLQKPGVSSVGVNDSAILLPCRYALSMDRLWTEGRWIQVRLKYEMDRVWIRKGVVKNMILPAGVHQFEHDGDCKTLTTEHGKLNGSNSGTCAVNLAYQWCYNSVGLQGAARASNRRVFLFGFDMQDGPNGEKHWYPNYPWRPNGATKPGNFRQWAGEFEDIAAKFAAIGVPVFNVNHRSAITSIPKITFDQFMEARCST